MKRMIYQSMTGLMAAILFFSALLYPNFAKSQSDSGFYLIYGNRDGSPMPVPIGSTLEIPVWGATAHNDYRDSVTFMHMPLSSNDSIITDRLGGYFADTLFGYWDDHEFLNPAPDTTVGWTNQSLRGFAYVIDPRKPQYFFWTNGDTVPIATFRMRVAYDSLLIGDTLCPFKEGYDHLDGGLLWGMQNGFTHVVPIATYPRLYFNRGCNYIPGDINGDGVSNGIDVIYAANYFSGSLVPLVDCGLLGGPCPEQSPFYAAGDVNGDCAFNGIDVTFYVRYLKGQVPGLLYCPDCPPSGNLAPAIVKPDNSQRMTLPILTRPGRTKSRAD